MFSLGTIHIATTDIHTVKPLEVDFPKGRMIAVTGVSGSGKTTMVLESLIPALEAMIRNEKLPEHVRVIQADGIRQVKLIDATPIGINVRSTVATYADVHDELRKVYARSADAKARGLKAGDFSYNTGKLRCPVCDGTGMISLDVQFLPDVDIPCPECGGSRYSKEAGLIRRIPKKAGLISRIPKEEDQTCGISKEAGLIRTFPKEEDQTCGISKEAGLIRTFPKEEDQACEISKEAGLIRTVSKEEDQTCGIPKKAEAGYTLPELMDMSIDEALEACRDLPLVNRRLRVLHDLGLGYLTLGEETPSLSGGEAQRLKLASEMGKGQADSVFVFDEPTIGLHPLDVETLLRVFTSLIDNGATVIVIEHDLDVIRNADYIIDMGPGGGVHGGRITAAGTPDEIRKNPDSVTGRYL